MKILCLFGKHALCKLGMHKYKNETCFYYKPIIETYNDPGDTYKRTRIIGSTSYLKNTLVCKYCGREK